MTRHAFQGNSLGFEDMYVVKTCAVFGQRTINAREAGKAADLSERVGHADQQGRLPVPQAELFGKRSSGVTGGHSFGHARNLGTRNEPFFALAETKCNWEPSAIQPAPHRGLI